MRYVFKGKSLEVTPALKRYAQTKFESLSRMFNKEDVLLEIEIERETRHHKKGLVYLVRAVFDIKARSPLVAKAESFDARSAIDIVRDILHVEAEKFKDKRGSRRRAGERQIKKIIRGV